MTEIRVSPLTVHLSGAWQPFIFLVLAMLAGLALAWLPLPLAAALVVGTALLLLILVQPLVGLALTLLVGPLSALENVVLGQTTLNGGQVLLLLTLIAWVGQSLIRRRIIISPTFLNIPLSIFIFVMALSLVDAPSLEFGLKEVVKWLEIGLVMLMVVDLAGGRVLANRRTGQRADPPPRYTLYVLAMLLLAGLSQAWVGIWQFALRGDGPEHFLVLGRFYRAYGTFEQPNPFGGFMSLTALLGMGALMGLLAAYRQSKGAGDKRQASRTLVYPFARASLVWALFLGLCTASAGLALLFSWSRGAWLGFAVAAAVLVLFWPKKRWHGVLLLAAAAVLFAAGAQSGIVPATVTGRLSSFSQDLRFGDVRGVDINEANYAVLERLAHWQAAQDMARDNIWLGVGFGNYEPAYSDYALINWPYPLGHAHNYYLNILAEAGIVGLAAYLIFWAAVFWQTLRVLRQQEWPLRGITLGLLAAWVALSVHHLVDKLYVNNIYIYLGVMVGLLQLLAFNTQQILRRNG